MGHSKRVLVSGASGFVGKYTIAPLLARGYDVHVVSRTASAQLEKPLQSEKNVNWHVADLLDCDAQRALIAQIRPSHLLHLAWYAEHGKFWNAVENAAWLKATISLAEIFYDAGGERMVGAGTCAEYEWGDKICVEGRTRECPASLYGLTKLAAGHCANALAIQHSASAAWARIFFPYGPGEPAARLIPYVIDSLLNGQPARCTHGKQLRDYLYAVDVGAALVAILDSKVSGPINLGSGVATPISDIVQRIGSIIGRTELIELGAIPEPAHSAPVVVADNARLRNEVNWQPRYTIEQGLQDMVSWRRQIIEINQ